MAISLTQLRANIYNIVDTIIKTGEPIDIERDGVTLRITPVDPQVHLTASKLGRLIPRKGIMLESPEAYVHIDWSHEWNP
jgi:hypothetical protein